MIRLVTLATLAALAGCVAGPVGPPGYDVGPDYYGPVGGVYSDWGVGYGVGPYRDFGHPYVHDHFDHPWHGPIGTRGIPSIPGGFHGGFRGAPAFHGGGRPGGGEFHGGGGFRGR